VVGKTLGHYRILAPLGSGGMGEVWVAEDGKLGRRVALKVLPPELAEDGDRVERFEREARAIAALDHPNIVTIHSVEHTDGLHFITMQLVEGRTLDQVIPPGGLPLARFFRIAIPLTDAVSAAHRHGVLHRDLKPSNIMVTDEGRVRVLDFGLAKLIEPGSADDATQLPTVDLTDEGKIVGTVAYMSPEQAEGRIVDQRSDIFSLGIVLYEMATGDRPFRGDTKMSLMSSIIKDHPAPITEVRAGLPRHLGRIIGRTLDKQPMRRFQTALDLRVELEDLETEVSSSDQSAPAAPVTRVNDLKSIAVLPFTNLSSRGEEDFFVDGMTDALITSLAKIRSLKVISRTSVMKFRGSDRTVGEIAAELGVGAIVEGSVLRAGDRIRITAQLIAALTDEYLWAESYDRDLSDVLSLQGEVAQAIAREVKASVTPEEKQRLDERRTVDPKAHEAYLRGRYCWNRRTQESLEQGIQYFNESIAHDPTYALAHLGLADCYNILGYYYSEPRHVFPRAKAGAQEALRLQPDLAEARTSLAYVDTYFDWNWDAAERGFRAALEQNPSYSISHQWYSTLLYGMERLDEGLAEMLKARDLDPLSLIINSAAGWGRYFKREYDEAIAMLRRVLKTDPTFVTARLWLGEALLMNGMQEAALQELREANRLGRGSVLTEATLAFASAYTGDEAGARKQLQDLLERAGREYVRSYHVALLYTGLGETDAAFEWLEKAFEERCPEMVYLKIEPLLDAVRDDARFGSLVARMGFPS